MKAVQALDPGRPVTFASCPQGMEAIVAADLARAQFARKDAPATHLLVVLRDQTRAQHFLQTLAFVAPDIEAEEFPAWDCLPYDRASPTGATMARRMLVLSRLAKLSGRAKPGLIVTTAQALTQRVPARKNVDVSSLAVAPGRVVKMQSVVDYLELNGFTRSPTVRDTGDYAVRGGILDLFPPGHDVPIRLDFFGDQIETIRTFDPETQRTSGTLRALDLVPVAEFQLTSDTMRRFRTGYTAAFGAAQKGDLLYEAISEGRRYAGMEHWLPLFHDRLDTLFDYLDRTPVLVDAEVDAAIAARFDQIEDYHEARAHALEQGMAGVPYKPLPPTALYLGREELDTLLARRGQARVTPFAVEMPGRLVVDVGGRAGRHFGPERATADANVFDAVAAHVRELQAGKKRVIITCVSAGSRERMGHMLADHGLPNQTEITSFATAQALPLPQVALAVAPFGRGFETDRVAVITEEDILGDRLVRPKRKARKLEDALAEVAGLTPGDLVVHVDHGIGRFVGLRTVTAAGAPHDCIEIHYHGGDKLFLPVENIELLTRYGSEETEVQLDRLGGAGWQTRKAKLKNRIREMAAELVKVAAARLLKEAPRYPVGDGMYGEFCAGFPFEETEDQQAAIDAVLDDLAAGRPMDRLVCGDVGFGKTEVALRAAFAAVTAGKQVAVVVPTTLLARQHFRTFSDRFRGLAVEVAQASRLVGTADLNKTRKGLADGSIDIIVGTHAVLGKQIAFKDLGLVIVDEEQHFGVGHKERLKQLRAEVHVLTLSATPIPRTLQLAMTGVRDLSIIATPPVDRLAVRTFIAPFDALAIREALLRERYRGGQSFYVCPRIEDLGEVKQFLDKDVPELKVALAHGQMPASQLEDIMSAFCDGRYDVLLSTSIVESGLDIPTANTMVVHRADMFGLAQLYQLRGRVGRGKIRAYALLTLPATKQITPQAEKRLEVLQSLDTLGAGFQLASHDLDIRGSGNLLGEEQSGHIKEVGYELYQQMLAEAVEMLKAGVTEVVEDQWSPVISIGTSVLIPETYVADLSVRLGLYRRLGDLETEEEIAAFSAELLDRFGKRPEEVEHLIEVAAIKALCRKAHVGKIDAGPKGAVIAFRDDSFANPAGLVEYVRAEGPGVKVRPDMKIVFARDWPTPTARLKGARQILRQLVKIAEAPRGTSAPAAPVKPATAPAKAPAPAPQPPANSRKNVLKPGPARPASTSHGSGRPPTGRRSP